MWLEVNFWANLGNKRNNKRSRKISPINLWSQKYTQTTNFLLPSHSARLPVVGTGLPTTLLVSCAPSWEHPSPMHTSESKFLDPPLPCAATWVQSKVEKSWGSSWLDYFFKLGFWRVSHLCVYSMVKCTKSYSGEVGESEALVQTMIDWIERRTLEGTKEQRIAIDHAQNSWQTSTP